MVPGCPAYMTVISLTKFRLESTYNYECKKTGTDRSSIKGALAAPISMLRPTRGGGVLMHADEQARRGPAHT